MICSSDSLLQNMAWHGVLSRAILCDVGARRRACRALRENLNGHADVALHPRARAGHG